MIRHPRVLLSAVVLLICPAGWLGADDFSFDRLRATARAMAATAYAPPRQGLDDYWKNLTYDQHRDIRFKMDRGLWAKDQLPLLGICF